MDIKIFTGSILPSDVSSAFGTYDTESTFKSASANTANWCASRLGYPIMDIELSNSQFFDCFEEATSEYSAQVNRFNIRENLLNARGGSTASNLTQTNVVRNQGSLIAISKQYGTEAGSGGNVDWKTGYITTTTGSDGKWKQEYDLDAQAIFSQSVSGTDIEIKRVFHQKSPAAVRHYDPQFGSNVALNSFGWGGALAGISYLSLPLYDDMLKIQQVEFNDTVRKSMYSFELINNKLKIHPSPSSAFKYYFQYIETNDRNNLIVEENTVSDFSNINYGDMTYASINSPGTAWIKKYTLALVKTVLGSVRSKYGSIPIPGSETSMDGDTLRSEGAAEAESLIEKLREDLEAASRRNAMERENEITTFQQEMLNKNPLNIYIG